MEKELNLICKAAERVAENYLKLTTACDPSGIVRERVFCYELYHQLRLCQDSETKLTLNGEIDKRGHSDFDIADRKNPDFVFHVPGNHEENTIVMEVKGRLHRKEIIKDFKTITKFVSSYQYQAGVFLLYNHSKDELLALLGNKINDFASSGYANKLFVITLPKAHGIEIFCSLYDLISKSK